MTAGQKAVAITAGEIQREVFQGTGTADSLKAIQKTTEDPAMKAATAQRNSLRTLRGAGRESSEAGTGN